MKNTFLVSLTAVLSLAIHTQAQAKLDRIQSSQAQAQSQTSSTSSKQVGLGLSTNTPGLPSVTSSALSGWIHLGTGKALQLTFGVGGTSPKFSMGLGSYYKYTLAASGNTGFHIGGGFGLGSILGKFFFGVGPVAGIHFFFPGLDHLLINMDAGATLTVVDGTVNFLTGNLSSILGASIHYLF